jgi:lysophospholipase L1-like esterase
MRSAIVFLLLAATACGPPRLGDDDEPSGDDGPSVDGPAGTPDDAPNASPIAMLDRPLLVIVVGDSIGAGFNASNNNAPGGKGYARLVTDNHPMYPDFADKHIRAIEPAVQFRDLAQSGATSDEAAARVRNSLGSLPVHDGDTLVLISVGGNDFNDSIQTILSPQATAQAAARLRTNLADIVERLRGKYDDGAGRRAVFAIDNIHDPTDGLGTIPPQFTDGFCGTIQNPLFTPQLRQQALVNLATMNTEIAAEVAELGAALVDVHASFLGHGMNGAGADKWLAGDCAHPTSDGHHHLREAVWNALTAP